MYCECCKKNGATRYIYVPKEKSEYLDKKLEVCDRCYDEIMKIIKPSFPTCIGCGCDYNDYIVHPDVRFFIHHLYFDGKMKYCLFCGQELPRWDIMGKMCEERYYEVGTADRLF